MAEKLEIISQDLTNHPHCRHGPTLLFSRTRENARLPELFYACAACRSSHDCTVHIPKIDYDASSKKSRKFYPRDDDYATAEKLREKIYAKKTTKRRFCHSCNIPFGKSMVESHAGHNLVVGISDDDLRQPTKLLSANDNDKTQAQYYFSDETLAVLGLMFQSLGISKVICMGAPRLHEYLSANSKQLKIASFLLDIDIRFLYFFGGDEFAWFNMFNHHFFAGNRQQDNFEVFLKEDDANSKTLLFTDPPFGCRTEPLIQTIKQIASTYNQINITTKQILPVFWIFPYYMEHYIRKFMPEMEMCDFKVAYANHVALSDGELGRKHGSPVRIFTNVPLRSIPLPAGYKFCSKCKRWVAVENKHCGKCRECPSKNGETYRHCKLCATCVKPNYEHCRNCGRCTQKSDHSCHEYQAKLNCWICRKRGHSERRCEKWLGELKRRGIQIFKVKEGNRICLVCQAIGHNEKSCPKRGEILNEVDFMGDVTNCFD